MTKIQVTVTELHLERAIEAQRALERLPYDPEICHCIVAEALAERFNSPVIEIWGSGAIIAPIKPKWKRIDGASRGLPLWFKVNDVRELYLPFDSGRYDEVRKALPHTFKVHYNSEIAAACHIKPLSESELVS